MAKSFTKRFRNQEVPPVITEVKKVVLLTELTDEQKKELEEVKNEANKNVKPKKTGKVMLVKEENNTEEKTTNMNRVDLERANNIVDSMNDTNKVKRIKSDKGLIERVEINKVVLTEDNKMLLND